MCQQVIETNVNTAQPARLPGGLCSFVRDSLPMRPFSRRLRSTDRLVLVSFLGALFLLPLAGVKANEEQNELVALIVDLLSESDKDIRALALNQVRSEVPGEAATREFAAQLEKLPAGAQVGLLSALADRGDAAARPSVVDLLETVDDTSVRVAAISALGSVGGGSDVDTLIKYLADEDDAARGAARWSLTRLPGDEVPGLILQKAEEGESELAAVLLDVLAARRAVDQVPGMLVIARGEQPAKRAAAMQALAALASPEHVADMAQALLATTPGSERSAAEKAIMQVCQKSKATAQQAAPLLAAMEELPEDERRELLPALGRVGGPRAITRVERSLLSADQKTHDLAVRAICNWPTANVALHLRQLAAHDPDNKNRKRALKALIRVAPLPDGREDADRLALVKEVLELCEQPKDKNTLLMRASAVRTMETLRFVLPFLEQPAHSEAAAHAIVELAHHRGLREPNDAEFHKALDQVIATSKDPVVIDRAQRYKKDQTWVRPK